MMQGPGWPLARAGMTVGLLGGSFDPAHAGHLHISQAALARFGLSRVWWLVSPGNPLKPEGPAPMAQRMQRAQDIAAGDPRLVVTDVERRLGTRHTAVTISCLKARYGGVGFVWLMGADNLAQVHEWEDWRRIFEMVPVGVLARPGQRISARMSKAAKVYGHARLHAPEAVALGRCTPPAWCFVNIPMRPDSSSALRRAGAWRGKG